MEIGKLISRGHVSEAGEVLISGEVASSSGYQIQDIKSTILLLNAQSPIYLWALYTIGEILIAGHLSQSYKSPAIVRNPAPLPSSIAV